VPLIASVRAWGIHLLISNLNNYMSLDYKALVVFDLDGTLLRGMTVCEVLAKHLGRLERMHQLERFQTLEELASAREEMARWYEGVPTKDLLDALRNATLAPGAKRGIKLLKRRGVAVSIASVTWEFAVAHFARLFGVHYWLGTALQLPGKIDHVWPEDKAQWVEQLCKQLKIPDGMVAAVGDSPSDAELFSVADHAFYVGYSSVPELLRCTHLPGADISELSKHILESFGIEP